MKFKTTKKEINNGYEFVISAGYCKLQYLLKWESPIAYTTRAEGWGSDIYDFGNTAIVTGYAPFGNLRVSYDLVEKYEETAKNVCANNSLSYLEKQENLRKLISDFIAEAVVPAAGGGAD